LVRSGGKKGRRRGGDPKKKRKRGRGDIFKVFPSSISPSIGGRGKRGKKREEQNMSQEREKKKGTDTLEKGSRPVEKRKYNPREGGRVNRPSHLLIVRTIPPYILKEKVVETSSLRLGGWGGGRTIQPSRGEELFPEGKKKEQRTVSPTKEKNKKETRDRKKGSLGVRKVLAPLHRPEGEKKEGSRKGKRQKRPPNFPAPSGNMEKKGEKKKLKGKKEKTNTLTYIIPSVKGEGEKKGGGLKARKTEKKKKKKKNRFSGH